MGVAGEDELLDARVWYSVMRSATSAWLPTSAVHVPTRTRPTPQPTGSGRSRGWRWRRRSAPASRLSPPVDRATAVPPTTGVVRGGQVAHLNPQPDPLVRLAVGRRGRG